MKNFLKSLKIVQFAILTGIIIFFSHCEKDVNEFGNEFLANRDSVSVLKDTLHNFSTFLEKEPKFPTMKPRSKVSKLMIGNITNEYFGQTKSFALAQYIKPSSVDSGIHVSSENVEAEIIITYDELFGSTNKMTIQLYVVPKSFNIPSDTTFYSNENPEDFYNTTGSPISDEIEHIKDDSTYKIKFTQNFTDKLTERTFQTVGDGLSLTEAIPGIVFAPGNMTGEGSLMSVSVSNCTMHLYRTKYTDTSKVIDTINYQINSNFGVRFNMFKHDFTKATATPNINTSLNSEGADSLLFIQNLQGTRARVEFSDIKEMQQKYDGKLIANASLIFGVRKSYNPQDSTESTMSAYIYKDDTTYISLNSYMNSVVNMQQRSLEGMYDEANNEMVFNLTPYYQSLLNGKVDNNTIYIHTANRGTSYNQIVLPGSKSNPPARLEIDYYKTSK